jgi:hypothetical protein
VGAGGFAREVHDVVEAINDAESSSSDRFEFLGFIDNANDHPELILDRGPLLGDDEALAGLPAGAQYVIAIGNGGIRRAIDERATALGLTAAILVHPSATMSAHRVELGPGSIICSHVSLTTAIRLGRHVHLNLNVTVGHDTVVGDYVTINPGASISGNVLLEDEVTIGTGAVIIQGKSVGARSMIGAGASVVRSIPADVTAVGIPAKVLGPRL